MDLNAAGRRFAVAPCPQNAAGLPARGCWFARARPRCRPCLRDGELLFLDCAGMIPAEALPGKIVHIWAEDRPKGRYRDLESEWGPVGGGPMEFHEVPGDSCFHVSRQIWDGSWGGFELGAWLRSSKGGEAILLTRGFLVGQRRAEAAAAQKG